MQKTWRWFGENDKITLSMLRQIGVEGIVTSLHHIPNGEVWSCNEILKRKKFIEESGLIWSVVESLPVSEAIKYGGKQRDQLIDNYIVSLRNLGECGVKTICYNFMPVIDWVRTTLDHPFDDGTSSLYFSRIDFAYFDLKILKRKNAGKDYSKQELDAVERVASSFTQEDKDRLVDTIIVKTQGFVNGNISEQDLDPVSKFKELLALYDDIDRSILRDNMKYFLQRIMPVCEEYGIKMCVHPDDPPFALLGLPRIVTNEQDIEWILTSVDNHCNGLTFCAGSLSAGAHNDVVALAEKFASRTHFVHLRSTNILDNGDFVESSHLEGRGHLIDLIRIFERENQTLPMRVDHGRMMLGDENKGYNAGYAFHGRMLALGQIDGAMAVVKDEIYRDMI
ncbi:MAG: mannonate dehydratase [Rikenellaceae bacterium]